MAETKLVTLNGLKKFKELLDNSYSQKFAEKGQTVDDESGYTFASDEEVDNLLDDIFTSSQSTDKESDNETKELLDDIFG